MASNDRLQKLQALLERQPHDTFLLYGLAMEYKKLNDLSKSLEYLDRVLQADRNYCYAYHQKGLIYEAQAQWEPAKQAYREGIAAAQRAGDAHARSELGAALAMIE